MTEAGLRFVGRAGREAEHAVDAGLKALARLLEQPANSTGWSLAARSGPRPCCSTCCAGASAFRMTSPLISIGEVELGPVSARLDILCRAARYETGKAAPSLRWRCRAATRSAQEVVKLPVTLVPHQSA